MDWLKKIILLVVLIILILAVKTVAFSYDYFGYHWFDSDLPVIFYINENGTPDCVGEFTAIQKAMETWNNVVCSYFEFRHGGTTSNNNGGIYDEINLISWANLQHEIVGQNTFWYRISTGRILESDIQLNSYYPWSCSGEAGRMDIQNVTTHELGHAVSLGDLYDPTDSEKTMYAYVSTGETKKRTLHPDDVDGICHIYPSYETFRSSICAIRERLTGKQVLVIYKVPLELDGETEPLVATDTHFGNSNWGNNIIAMVCVNTDGDGVDEIAVIRQRANGRQRLEIYNPPQSEGGDTGNPIASDLTFGDLNSDKNNIAMAGVDIDGDGTDEIAVIREKQTGKQRLFIFNAPQGIGGQTEPAIATDMSFGFRDTGRNIIAMTGLDINGDGVDEIAVIMQRASGRQRLEIYNAPQGVGGETGPPIASDLTFGNSTTRKNTIVITNVDVNGDNMDEIAVVRQGADGCQRLEIYNPPETVGGETGPPIASDLSFGEAGTDRNTMAISGIKF